MLALRPIVVPSGERSRSTAATDEGAEEACTITRMMPRLFSRLRWRRGGGQAPALLLLLSCAAPPVSDPEPPRPPLQEIWSALFDGPGDLQGWDKHTKDAAHLRIEGTVLKGRSTGFDPMLYSPPLRIPTGAIALAEVRMKASLGDTVKLFFVTDLSPGWSEAQSATARLPSPEWSLLTFDLRKTKAFEGTLTRLRLDPTTAPGALFEIDYVRLMGPLEAAGAPERPCP